MAFITPVNLFANRATAGSSTCSRYSPRMSAASGAQSPENKSDASPPNAEPTQAGEKSKEYTAEEIELLKKKRALRFMNRRVSGSCYSFNDLNVILIR